MTRPIILRACLAVLLCATLTTLTACGPTGDDSERVAPVSLPVFPQLTTYPDIPVIADIPYESVDGDAVRLDLCFPADAAIGAPESEPRPAIVLIHGGSWHRGDKSNLDMRSVCQWLASEGYVTASINYRLAPEFSFPAALQDAQAAVRWLRDPAQVQRYDIDPDRIGAFGGSAGGNLAALLGTSGTGSWTQGSRVAAVVDLSGPSDLRAPILTTESYTRDFAAEMLEYVGCRGFVDCPSAAGASPVTLVDESDPPFFVGHSTEEFIPIRQAEALVETLRASSIDTTFVTVEGTLHSIGMLDDAMRQRIADFYAAHLRG